jgi:hypothetical protein
MGGWDARYKRERKAFEMKGLEAVVDDSGCWPGGKPITSNHLPDCI